MESMQWKHKTSPTPKKFRVEKSAGKIMVTVLWDEKGLLLLEFMPQKTTITGQTYANTITALRGTIQEKRRGNLSAGVLLLHDNAPVHMSPKSQAAIRQCEFQQLNHPPYSTDLAPSDYFLFRVMKKFLRGKRFSNDEEFKEAFTTWFEEQSKDLFSRGIKFLQQKWAKCIELLEDYIEKKIFFCSKLFLSYSGS
jgi:histone-lysine N-methyltransferase SETMAR